MTDDAAPEPPARRWSRRRLLTAGGLGSAGLLGAGLWGGGQASGASIANLIGGKDPDIHGGHGDHGDSRDPQSRPATTASDGHYIHGFAPPTHLGESALDALTYPPRPDVRGSPTTRSYDVDVTTRQIPVSDSHVVEAWTYGGTAPGPILRATEGDTLRVTLANRTAEAHNLHLHGRHHPAMDGWEPIPPGGSFTYEVAAEPFGLHPYHCHTHPLDIHMGKGLYGALIVDPPGGREPAHEVVLVLGGWDVDGDGANEVYAWNGVAGFYEKYPIKVPRGELVRAYVLNLCEHDPIGSFHLHAATFDVFRTGTSTTPNEHTDVVSLAQGERAILEFRLPEPGRYMFHPHQHRMAARGATGWFAAV